MWSIGFVKFFLARHFLRSTDPSLRQTIHDCHDKVTNHEENKNFEYVSDYISTAVGITARVELCPLFCEEGGDGLVKFFAEKWDTLK